MLLEFTVYRFIGFQQGVLKYESICGHFDNSMGSGFILLFQLVLFQKIEGLFEHVHRSLIILLIIRAELINERRNTLDCEKNELSNLSIILYYFLETFYDLLSYSDSCRGRPLVLPSINSFSMVPLYVFIICPLSFDIFVD